ncbi:unnamed protein product [Acanthosepion pharaonis]|uniref:Uncharacterized protein n=1 Tax=Acanthosepion pharaonis TaxID=158019 RepID=A0A812DW59_ACAPH|nr:unnamed protein product [Sepia pharaonis]
MTFLNCNIQCQIYTILHKHFFLSPSVFSFFFFSVLSSVFFLLSSLFIFCFSLFLYHNDLLLLFLTFSLHFPCSLFLSFSFYIFFVCINVSRFFSAFSLCLVFFLFQFIFIFLTHNSFILSFFLSFLLSPHLIFCFHFFVSFLAFLANFNLLMHFPLFPVLFYFFPFLFYFFSQTLFLVSVFPFPSFFRPFFLYLFSSSPLLSF